MSPPCDHGVVNSLRRPLIGLSTYRAQARWGVWDLPADLLPSGYARSVEAAGGIAVMLPTQDAEARDVVSRLDGLIITGGPDVDPGRYGAQPHPQTGTIEPERDAWELSLLDAAQELGIPALGICRGMQVMAIHAGGTLDQHTPDVVDHEEHSPGGSAFGWVSVTTAADSLVRTWVGNNVQVTCHHHQSVATAPGFVVSARAGDGTIEAIEAEPDSGRTCWLGVQWHPENGDDLGVFNALIDAARQRIAP